MSWVITTILFVLTVANTLFIYLVFREIQMIVRDFDRKMMELHLDTELSEAFDGQDMNDLDKLATDLMLKVKKKYNLTAQSYSDLIPQVRGINADDKLIQNLVDFFEHIVAISYKNQDMSEDNKSDLKAEYKLIVTMMSKK